jgi:WD40 repeat protein
MDSTISNRKIENEIKDNESIEVIFEIQTHPYIIHSVMFTLDGKLFASGIRGESIKVFNFLKFEEEFTLNGHSKAVNCVVFSDDGNLELTGKPRRNHS